MAVAYIIFILYNINMKRKIFSLFLAAAFLIPLFPINADAGQKPHGFTDYNVSGPVAVSTVASGNYSSKFMRFWEDITGDAVEEICKAAEVNLSQNAHFADDVIGLQAGFKRKMRRFPNSQLALIDEVSFKPSAGTDIPFIEKLDTAIQHSFFLHLNSSVEGKSQVVRPLKGEDYCTELRTLIKFYNVKTAWPPSVRRLENMAVGEIWKLPITFNIKTALGITGTAVEAIEFQLSASAERSFNPSVTVFRMAEDKMRLRIRIGTVKLRSIGASASSIEIPVESLALWNADNFIARFINRKWASEINKSLALKFSFTKNSFKGKQLVLEYICNPKDHEQMKNVSNFLKGDFGILKKMIALKLDFHNYSENETVADAAHEIQEMANKPNSALQAAQSYAGASIYDGSSANISFQLPIVYKRETYKEQRHSTYQAAGTGEQLSVYKNTKTTSERGANLPFAGSVLSHNYKKTSYVVQKFYENGTSSKPLLMYTQYDGGVHISGDSTADAIEKANDILKYVGTNGNGVNEANTINADDVMPKHSVNDKGEAVKASKIYSSVASEFKLMINEDGIQEILFAPAAALMKAYFNIVRKAYKHVLSRAGDLFRIDESGHVSFDQLEAKKRFRYESDARPLRAMRRLAAQASKLIADIFDVKKTSDSNEQARKFANLVDGKGSLGAADFLKVVVQMLDPSQVTATFAMDSRNRKTGKNHYEAVFFNSRGKEFDSTLNEVENAENRFDEPALLTD